MSKIIFDNVSRNGFGYLNNFNSSANFDAAEAMRLTLLVVEGKAEHLKKEEVFSGCKNASIAVDIKPII